MYEILFNIGRVVWKNRGFYSACYAVVLLLGNYLLSIGKQLAALALQVSTLTMPSFQARELDMTSFSLINYVIPLDLALTYFVAWLALWITCMTIRFIKSFIPTVS